MKTFEKLLPIAIWFVVGITLFLLAQNYFEFHFYYAEQLQLFLYNKTFLSDLLFSFGGLSEIICRWLIQFYIYPKIGALITTIFLLSVAILMNRISRKINTDVSLILLPLLAAIFIFFLHLNQYYYVAGTIAFIFVLAFFLIYLKIVHPRAKIIVASSFTVLLFWWAGSIAFLFVITIILWQLLTDRKHILYSFIPLLIFIILAYASINLAWIGDYKQIFLPILYFHSKLTPPLIIYFPWGLLLLLVLFSFVFRNQKISRNFQYFVFICQIIITCATIYYLFPIYGQFQFSLAQYKKLDYYTRMDRWDDIIEESKKPLNNLLLAHYRNIALMETNQLGNQFLQFNQGGMRGLVPERVKGFLPSLIILNELNFTLGDIAASQYFAFESNLIISKNGSPRLYKRLVQTNLINGDYRVAEKYIKLLEQTHYYKEWATEQRRFLYNDKVVIEDQLLGKKRRGQPSENYLLLATELPYRLQLLAKSDPTNTAAIEYLASIYLFEKQNTLFIELVDKYYNTEESLINLPEKFQEAIIMIKENNPAEWKRYKISSRVVIKYRNFKQMFLKNKDNPNIVDLLYQNFGNTYWSYFMFYK